MRLGSCRGITAWLPREGWRSALRLRQRRRQIRSQALREFGPPHHREWLRKSQISHVCSAGMRSCALQLSMDHVHAFLWLIAYRRRSVQASAVRCYTPMIKFKAGGALAFYTWRVRSVSQWPRFRPYFSSNEARSAHRRETSKLRVRPCGRMSGRMNILAVVLGYLALCLRMCMFAWKNVCPGRAAHLHKFVDEHGGWSDAR